MGSLSVDATYEKAQFSLPAPYESEWFAKARNIDSIGIRLQEIEQQFRKYAAAWKEDTLLDSSPQQAVQHPAYQQIISLGPDAVPLILRELVADADLWFEALRRITRQNPVRPSDVGNPRKMADAWLEWGRKQGYEC